ncbi:MAG: starch synthase [Deltaproteobacteria bacterium RIFOXYA12_FULL_58_15]|nr:MAG: starch synthase [Deltaproteobacteria bacterium RIFOXYA12_FULL_58_15]OGR11366.1 MAG: starch synthase [Deltaproteobacteria bacterium RIFOXYB12_FULL_58_9]
MAKILFCASEVVPFARAGALADVGGSLPPALARLGHDIRVVMPLYASVDRGAHGLELDRHVDVPMRGRGVRVGVWRGKLPNGEVPVYFIDSPAHFHRQQLYQQDGEEFVDNVERFALLSRAALQLAKEIDFLPDIVHCNDWQTGLIPVYLKTLLRDDPSFASTASVLTIHDLAYQGLGARDDLLRTGLGWEYFTMAGLEFFGGINLLKGGIMYADAINTVSPTYGREIQTAEFGARLEGVIATRADDLCGILNGVDYEVWDPRRDEHIQAKYGPGDLAGKAECKRALQRKSGLGQSVAPLIGVVSRLDTRKGCDLLLEIIPEVLHLDVQMVILGTGDPQIEAHLQRLSRTYSDRLSVHMTFDEGLAHQIQAGADIFLMPSQYEPCGLNQMHSLRYGTIPVVRRTGGLADTVVDYLPSTAASMTATGFQFGAYHPPALLKALLLALMVYENKPRWKRLIEAAMAAEFTWGQAARSYDEMYRRLLRG